MKTGWPLGIGFFALLFLVFPANAALVNVTYTADNIVNAWYYGTTSYTSISPGPNASDWTRSDTAVLDLQPGQYTLVWQVQNLINSTYPQGSSNPAGFLAQISSPYISTNNVLSSANPAVWQVAVGSGSPDSSSLTWVTPTAYAFNSGSSVWMSANGGNSVSGISTLAQWIWSSNNINDQNIFVRATINVVPIPTAVWLLGTGLVGLVAVKRRLRQ